MSNIQFASRLRAGGSLRGAWSVIGDPVVAEVLAADDFDFVVLDGEHSENTIGELADLVRAVDAVEDGAAPVVRVSAPDRAEIRRVLDLGPEGVIVPQIESVEDARDAVKAATYPPEGVRGVAGGRASGYGTDIDEYVATAGDQIATILQIETGGAVDDIEEIVQIEGLDALFIGPADLSARLGVFGAFEDSAFTEAVETVVAAANAADLPVGTLATAPENVETRLTEWEMDFLVAGTDVGYLRAGAERYRERLDHE